MLQAAKVAAKFEYGVAAFDMVLQQLLVFEEDKITLDLTEDGVVLENGWSITPLTDLEVRLHIPYNYIVHECRFSIFRTDCKAPG